jgi:2-succinyl-5-enolpyruvyl-6-hydroxy-3-cyclohexene-1-carboxylate synthase
MKKYINLNNLFTDFFVKILITAGVKHVVISPGSRNTPLVLAFEKNNRIKKHVIIDERSNGFYALGLAKSTNSPVAIITTSGSAVTELYPSVVEAFYSRVPLIICTADRPQRLVNKGSNQTIDQYNIYSNHIRYFWDSYSITPSIKYFRTAGGQISKGLLTSTNLNVGPAHLNFRFEKPLERFTPSHAISQALISYSFALKKNKQKVKLLERHEHAINSIINSHDNILLLVGNNIHNKNEFTAINKISKHLNAPIIADGLSGFRYGQHNKNILLLNSTAFIRNRNFTKFYDPNLIIQFGNAPTSNILLNFFAASNAKKILVNNFGDITDPSETYDYLIKYDIDNFSKDVLSKTRKRNQVSRWCKKLEHLDDLSQKNKKRIINNSGFGNEARIIKEMFDNIPHNSNLMISNSIPPRDVDYFADSYKKRINVFHNRGTSGIDGIIATSAGICLSKKNPTYLLIGDTAFTHDIGSLLLLKQFKIPLTIVLINNSGGSIFEMLPVKKEKTDFQKFFKTPSGLKFEKIVKAFDGNHMTIKSWKQFIELLPQIKNNFRVLELKTDSLKSLSTRKAYWEKVIKDTQEIIDVNKK